MSGQNPMDIIASLSADTGDAESGAVTAEVVENAIAEVRAEEGTPPDPVTPATDGGVENDPEDEAHTAGEVTETGVEPTLYAGKYKTPEELENAYKHAEQRMHQEAQQRAQYEQYITQMQEQYEQEQAQRVEHDPFAPTPQSVQELIEYTYEEPEEAFWFSAQNAPQQMSRVVNEIRQFDPATADRLLVEYNQWQYEVQQNTLAEQQQNMQQEIERVRAEAQMPYMQAQAANAVARAHQNIASLDNYETVKDDMATIIRERPHLINVESESTLAIGLRDVYDLAIARNSAKIHAANTAREAAAGAAGVESGNFAGQNVVEEEDPTADFKAGIYGSINGFAF